MATFDPTDDLDRDRAFWLVHNLFVTMFCSEHVLSENVDWLTQNAYQVVEVDVSRCVDTAALLGAL